MKTNNKNNKALIIAIAVLGALLLISGSIHLFRQSQSQEGIKNITLEINASLDENSEPKIVKIETEAENLLDAMIEEGLIKQEDYSPGQMIDTIDGIKTDASQNQWWMLAQNGEMLNTGFPDTIISDGETYEITLSSY